VKAGVNTIRIKEGKQGKWSLFSAISTNFKLEGLFEEGLPTRFLPKVLFIALLAVVYIWNSHMADKMVRQIDKLSVEVEDLRADFTTLKSNYMVQSKRSEVKKRVESLGLEESKEPPYKIIVKKGEY
jgi:cell division protein FtsL